MSTNSRPQDSRVRASLFRGMSVRDFDKPSLTSFAVPEMLGTRIEPAGAGGATGGHFQLRRHQLGRGGRWRRSRHLRRVQRPRQGGMEIISFPYRYRFKFPFFERSFHEITNEFCSESVQKPACKKLNKQHARTQTDRIEPILSSSADVFWTVKTQIPVAKASKTCP